jgi:hypothetical protein
MRIEPCLGALLSWKRKRVAREGASFSFDFFLSLSFSHNAHDFSASASLSPPYSNSTRTMGTFHLVCTPLSIVEQLCLDGTGDDERRKRSLGTRKVSQRKSNDHEPSSSPLSFCPPSFLGDAAARSLSRTRRRPQERAPCVLDASENVSAEQTRGGVRPPSSGVVGVAATSGRGITRVAFPPVPTLSSWFAL